LVTGILRDGGGMMRDRAGCRPHVREIGRAFAEKIPIPMRRLLRAGYTAFASNDVSPANAFFGDRGISVALTSAECLRPALGVACHRKGWKS
jgi:hypothetical protein